MGEFASEVEFVHLKELNKEYLNLQSRINELNSMVKEQAEKVRIGKASTGDEFKDWAFMNFGLGFEPQLAKIEELKGFFAGHVGELVMVRETYFEDKTPQLRYVHRTERRGLVPPHQHIDTSYATSFGVLVKPGLEVLPGEKLCQQWQGGDLFHGHYRQGPFVINHDPVLVHPLLDDTFAYTQSEQFGPRGSVTMKQGIPVFMTSSMLEHCFRKTDEGYTLRIWSNLLRKGFGEGNLQSVDVVAGDAPVRKALFEDTRNSDAFHVQSLEDIAALYNH